MRRTILIFSLTTILALTGVLFFIIKDSPNPLEDFKSTSNFKLYYPRKITNGFKLSKDSIVMSEGVLLFKITKDDKTISVSQQKKPETYDFSSLKGERNVLTDNGQLTIAVKDSTTTASLLTPTTWVIVRTNDTIDTNSIDALMRTFEPIE